mmetsp:Transcript_10136/g.19508  ORF Transcript_10136/g.19508 Transcript_10136/m.19508 type:complete len:355 (+) Transcript_10136:85-1149(+)|eukprot:scaffold394_cov166-Amphora_coffeaeformis.AAC.2
MVEISTPLSCWMQIGSLCFTLSGIHSDLMIIRFFLFVAYVMLFINAVLGSPLWPNVTNSGYLPLDSLFWSIAGLYVHGASLLNLILDERPVELNEEEAALWRMFYRTGGLSARLYKNIVSPYVKVVTFKPGEEIPVEDFFYILYKGNIHLKIYEGEVLKRERETMHSGAMFDMKYLGMFAEDHFFLDHSIACTSKTTCTLFCFSRADMKKIAQHHLVKSVWQSLLINNLSALLEKYMEKEGHYSSDPEDTDRIFGPLEDWELPRSDAAGSGSALKYPWNHFWNSLYRQFSPPWPFGNHLSGIRQTGLSAPVNSPSSDPDRVPPMHGSSRTLVGEKSTSGKSDDCIPEEEEAAEV